jgi:hypothetical protein
MTGDEEECKLPKLGRVWMVLWEGVEGRAIIQGELGSCCSVIGRSGVLGRENCMVPFPLSKMGDTDAGTGTVGMSNG